MGEKLEYVGEGTGGDNMNVLMIGTDSTLAMDKDKVIGDSQDRHIMYGKYLSKIFIVVLSKKEQELTVKRLSDNVIVYPTSSRRFFSVLDAYKIAKKICRENKIEVVTVQGPFLIALVGYMLKKRVGIPLNVQLHGGECLDNRFWLMESKIHYFLNALGKFIVKRADSIRAISKRLESYLIKDLEISPERIINFPISIDVTSFLKKGQEEDISTTFSAYDNIILFVGNLIKQKNADLLLKAAPIVLEKFPSTLFLIVGEGPDRAKLENLTNRLNIKDNVIFEGKVANNMLPSYYHLCTMFVFPSNYEGWGRVAIEALACGKPVITTDVGCANEAVIDGKNGYVVPLNSPDTIAQRIIYLLENPQIRQRMGQAGLEYVQETQNREKDGQKWVELCHKTVELALRRK